MELLTKADAAMLLGVHIRTIENMILRNELPRPKSLGRRVHWLKHDFEAHLIKVLGCNDDKEAPINSSSPSAASRKSRP